MLLNNQRISEETEAEIKNTQRQRKTKGHPKPMGHGKSSSKREVYSNTVLLQETRKIPNKQPNLTLKATRETGTNKTQKLEEEKKL